MPVYGPHAETVRRIPARIYWHTGFEQDGAAWATPVEDFAAVLPICGQWDCRCSEAEARRLAANRTCRYTELGRSQQLTELPRSVNYVFEPVENTP